MSDRIVPESFDFLLKKYKDDITITEDKIYFGTSSFLAEFLSVLVIFAPIILCFFQTNAKYNEKIDTFYQVIIILVVLLFINSTIKAYKIIDFKNGKIYQEDRIFGMSFKAKIIEISEILQVANNIIPKLFSPGGKTGLYKGKPVEKHPETNYFQYYYLSFFLKNGELINFYEFGIGEKDYKASVKVAKAFSDYFSKELVFCDSKKRLEPSFSKLETQNIEPISESTRIFWTVFLKIILPFSVGIIIAQLLNSFLR